MTKVDKALENLSKSFDSSLYLSKNLMDLRVALRNSGRSKTFKEKLNKPISAGGPTRKEISGSDTRARRATTKTANYHPFHYLESDRPMAGPKGKLP